MKKNITNLFLLLAVAVGFSACSDSETADVTGITGDFAYIVNGQEALYQATTCEVFHTPDAEEGTVSMDLTVAITRTKSAPVTLQLALDNTLVSDTYSVLPAGVLNYDEQVTIPAGEKQKTITVTIAQSDFAKLVEPQYMAAFRITSATDTKISSGSNVAYLFIDVTTIDPADNQILIANSTSSYTINNYTNETTGDAISKTISISGSESAYTAFDIELGINNELIAAYNEANGTAYEAIPSEVPVTITTANMAQAATSTSATVSIANEDRSKLTADGGYLIPIVVKEVGKATIGTNSGVAYLAIRVKNFDSSSNFFSALYLGDYRMATNYIFANPIDLSSGYTYVFHILMDEVTAHSRIGDFCDANENWINMLRFGQQGSNTTTLEWFVGPNGRRKQLYTKAFEINTWYQVALVYNTSSYKIYVEGEEVASYTLTDEDKTAMASLVAPSFQRLEFNSSWGDSYRQGNEFHGRLWQVGVFKRALSQNWIANYCYRGYHSALISNANNGMAAYWAMNDGVGSQLEEGTGRYEAIDFRNTYRWNDSDQREAADVSAYVQWKADAYNSFD